MKKLTYLFLLLCGVASLHAQTIRYVKPVASGSGNGSSWANASSDLQVMIDASAANDEVWVAAGTYKPAAYPTGSSGGTSSRDYAFLLKDGVKVYGGFAGTETLLAQRNYTTNPTTLSGDIGTIGNNTSSPSVSYCTFSENAPINDGGGILIILILSNFFKIETHAY